MVMVLSLPGDRCGEAICTTVEATIPFVDEYVLHDQQDRRGRTKMEIPRLIQGHLPSDTPYSFASGHREAILKGWRCARPGDRLIIIADIVDESLETLNELSQSVAADAACTSPLTPAATAR